MSKMEIRTTTDKKPFSELVGEAVDQIGAREFYKGANNRKIALHVKELMQVLSANHRRAMNPQEDNVIVHEAHASSSDTKELMIQSNNMDMGLSHFASTNNVQQFFMELPKVMMHSPEVSFHDRLLVQTVIYLISVLTMQNIEIENDIELIADEITETITTTRVPNRNGVRNYIDKKTIIDQDKSVGFKDRNKFAGKMDVEELYRFDFDKVAGDSGIDEEFWKSRLKRITKGGTNIFLHTPFEYFHEYTSIPTNDPKRPIYMLRTFTTADPTRKRRASIVTFIDENYKLLHPDFPAIDDSESNQFTFINAFGMLNIGRCGQGLFFEYKDQLYILKDGKYMRPAFTDDLAGEIFSHVRVHKGKNDKEVKGYFEIHTKTHCYVTDNQFSVLGKSVEDVRAKKQAKAKAKKKK